MFGHMADSDRMTTAEVATRLGVTIRTVVRMAQDGRLPPALKFPGMTGPYLFDRNVVEMFARHLAREAAS
jgi:excisionase family DNA binding protein